MSKKEQKQLLESLLLSSDLKELNALYNKFNIFKVLKLENNEIRHSNFLAWLMTPYENHNIGDYFLKEFLRIGIKIFSSNQELEATLKNIVFDDLSDTEIKREYKNIDLLIINTRLELVCIIENKIWSNEHSNQLVRYAETIKQEFKNYKKLYFYLTPKIKYNSNLIERKVGEKTVFYVPISYQNINEILATILKFKSEHINSDIRTFIEHYQIMIERDIMHNSNTDIVRLCRKIYRENKTAIDLIMKNIDVKAELKILMREFVEKHQNDFSYIDYENDSKNITCLPYKIANIEKLQFSSNWKPNNIIARVHFGCCEWGYDGIYSEILIGPVEVNNKSKRELLLNLLKEYSFNINKSAEYITIENTMLLSVDEYRNCDSQEEAMMLLEERFNEIKDLFLINFKEVLNNFMANI